MYKKGLAYKLLSFFSLLNLSLQPFFNFLLISAPAFVLAQEQIEAGITFDKGKNSFNLTVNKPGEIHYELFYRTASQVENVSGTSKNDGGSFSQEIYAGTCSSGGACTPHQVLRGILKIEVENEGWLTSQKFTIDNGKLNLVEESVASSLNLTDEENSWLENPEQQKIEKECLTNQSLVDTKDEDWQVDKEKETAETKEKIKLGVKYVFPLENKVSVSFKCLPKEGATPLKIQKVKISALNLPEGINPYGEYAYDITTGMQDGTFEYEITLPKPENATAEVSYIEKSVEDATKNEIKTDEVKAVEEEKLAQEGDKVKVEGLDHLTIFVVTGGVDGTVLIPHTLTVEQVSELTASDNIRYESDGRWPLYSYSDNEYIQFNFNPELSDSATITSAVNLIFEYQRDPLTTNSYNNFYKARILIFGQNTNKWDVLSNDVKINDPLTDQTSTITIPDKYVNSIDKINNLKIRFQTVGRKFDTFHGIKTYHDYVALDFSFKDDTKMNICHKTSSASNPWNAIRIDVSAWHEHQTHGDFVYDGPLKPNGHPDNKNNQADTWCKNNVPARCGDGYKDIGEQCDDGNTNDGDGCSANCTIEIPACEEGAGWATNVESVNQRTLKNGAPIADPTRTDSTKTLGANDGVFFSLGYGGSIILSFVQWVTDTDGNDLSFHETTWGRSTYPVEKAEVFVSQDGDNWQSLGEVTNKDNALGVSYKDISSTGWDWIKYVKLVDTTNDANHIATADGYDLDAVDVVAGVCEEPQPEATVKICKNNSSGNPLSGWQVVLREQLPVETVTVLPTGASFSSISLPANDYILRASGYYTYRPGTVGAEYTDANFSKRAPSDSVYGGPYTPWVNVNNFPDPIKGWLGVMVNNSATNWSSVYNPDHIYALGYANYSGAFSFKILDDNYSDNSGNIPVGIYHGWTKFTGEDGCATFENIELGDYYVEEILRDSWVNDSGIGTVTVDDAEETFTITNHKILPYCGDGVINQDSEQCDGKAGVGENQFCTSNCKLVPIYTGSQSCSTGKTPVLKDSKSISSISSTGTSVSVTSGQEYLFEINGVYNYDKNNQAKLADAAYATGDNWSTVRGDIGIWGTNRGVTSVLGDFGSGVGVVEWDNDHTINSDHKYQMAFTPTTGSLQFLISDWYDAWYPGSNNQGSMSDNSGDLTLNIYECQDYGSISGIKYEDKNGNGQRDSDENNLLSGWTINLKNESGSDPIASTTTDTPGNYQFSNVLPGNYQVCEINQTGWWVTDPQEGYISGEACKDITVYAGQSSSVNFGNFKGVSIGGYKFEDLNGDSQKNDGEQQYLNGWLIRLYKLREEGWDEIGSHPTGSFTEQETGEYGWSSNGPGTYFVCEVITDHPNWVQTYPNTATANAVANQSGNTNEAPFCYQITTSSGVDYNNLNFGNFKLGMVQGKKFKDLNHNGTRDGGDSYLDKWGIYLFDSQWRQLKTMKTGDDRTEAGNVETGQYRFINLEKGDYYVCEDKKAGWDQTKPSSGPVNDNGSVCYPVSVITSGQEVLGLTFGNFELGKVQGMKYDDEDGDGAPHEADEGFMNEWTIRLYKDWEEPVGVVTSNTGTKGQYRYADLFPGTYQVCEVLNEGWTQTWPKVGDVPIEDNGTVHSAYGTAVANLSGATGEGPVCWQTVIDTSGDFNQLLRFGNIQYGSVEVYKFEDLDGDGKKDGGEPPLPDWEILLGDQTATTNAQGKATFTNLVAGEYNLNENLKDGWQQTRIYCTSDEAQTGPTPTPTLTPTPTTPLLGRVLGVNPVFAQIANNNSHQVIVNPGEVTTCYIGNFELGSISGTKIYDKDDDGVQDEDEKGIEGWKIFLSGGYLTEEISTTTDSDGNYEFTGLTAGVYTVQEEKRDGWRASKPESGKSGSITISSGIDAKFDFFNAPPVSILLTKSNNATAPVKPGDLVEYTLTITVGERTLSKMTLIDVLPDGFSYQTNTSKITTTLGSSTATVNSEPTLKRANKKLVWAWPAGIAGGSVVVVKYTVKIDATNKPSSYTNFAYVWGSGSPTLVESQIVDSVVKIEPAYAPEGKVAGGEVLSAATQTAGQIEGQVLGATLPAAGANTWFLLAAIALIGAGLALRPKKKENRQKN